MSGPDACPRDGRVHVALIGGGRISDLHAPAYLTDPRARLYALCDRSPGVCQRRAKEWDLGVTYTDYDELLRDSRVDAVEILTPHHLHHGMVIAAAEAGKHVSVQKPMALDVRQCDEMIDACARNAVVLKVFENFVFHPPYVWGIEQIRRGELGTPLAIRMRVAGGAGGWTVPLRSWIWRLRVEQSGGGPAIFDDGFHKFSVAIDFFGPVRRVAGWQSVSFGILDTPASFVWEHESGVIGSLDFALAPNWFIDGRYYAADERIEIVCEKGTMHFPRCTSRPTEEPPIWIERNGNLEAHGAIESDWLDSFVACGRDFVGAIVDGRAPKLTGERGREVTAFVAAALRSAEKGGAWEAPE